MSFRTLLAMLVMMVATAIPARAPAATKTTPETALHRIQRTVAAIDAEAKTPGGETRVVGRLSGQLGVPPDTLIAEHGAWGLGYGELSMVHSFARASRSGKSAGDVVAMRNSGMEWLDIAKQLGVKVDTVANRMKRHVPPKAKR